MHRSVNCAISSYPDLRHGYPIPAAKTPSADLPLPLPTSPASFLGNFALSSSVAAAMLAGCGGPQSPIGPQGAMPQSRATLAGQKSKTFLYVGILGGGRKANFLVYPIDALKPLRKFDVYWGVAAMAIDRWGDIYTTNGFPSGGSITAFTPGGRSVLLSFIAYPVNALAFDRRGHLYAASVGVGEYRPRSSKLIRGLGEGIDNPDALAVDGSGNVYVASDSNSSSGLGKGSIEVFPPHGKQLPIAPAAMSAIQKVQ